MINQLKQEIVLSRDSKELFVQRFVQVFDQNRKHVEAQNQTTDCGRTVRSRQSEVFFKKAALKNFAIFIGSTCVGVSFFKKLQA